MTSRCAEQGIRTTPATIDGLATQFFNRVFSGKGPLRRRKHAKLPWDSWQLDEDFLSALSRWTLEHPETTLDRVLKDISNGIQHSKDLFSLIPDSPFPARGLVTALGFLFILGATIAHAQKDVQEFANDVVQWVEQVMCAFESAQNGEFTRLAWRDLKHMRDLVDEICRWAVERLDDGRWSRIGNGMRIQGEIQEFKEQIADARTLFQDLSAINLAKGIDAIFANLQRLLQLQHTTLDQIKSIRKAQQKQFAQIMSELTSQKLAVERDRFIAEVLGGQTVVDPTYLKQGKQPCDPETRREVLAEISEWIKDISPGSKNFLWLTGDPGCGKSAITASVSKECRKRDILWAQFFINRNNVETTDPNSYFPSIASQLAHHSPYVAQKLQSTLLKDRTLADGISADQAAKLFIDSIRCASQLDPKQPVVVVIDGLDETDRKRLEVTAKIFSTLFTSLKSYSNVKVFISSRTENDIRNSFLRSSHDKHVKRIHLDTADPSSIRDVSYYIKQNLLAFVTKHDLNWVLWPGDRRSQLLGERASGLFIWGVTAMKFLQERLDFDGTECLNDVLDMLTANVLYDVNSLYMLILKVTYGAHASEWDMEKFRRIVGAIVCLQEPLCISDLETLLDLRKTPSSDPVDILHFVRRFRTILVAGTDIIDGSTIPRIHKSVFEFITSDSVDPLFRIELESAHLEIGMQCLSQLGLAHTSVTKDMLPLSLRYASRSWSLHLSQAKLVETKVICADCRHTSVLPLPLFPLAFFSTVTPLRISYWPTESHIRTMVGNYAKRWDASSGFDLTNHTEAVTSLAFSPDGTQVVSNSKDGTIRNWDSTGRWLRAIIKHPSPVHTIAFSPDGKSIVSGSENGLLYSWNSSTGAPIGRPFHRHTSRILCVAFSPDGMNIVSGSGDQLCILWNAQNGQVVGKPWTGHQYGVSTIAFSASGQRVCSGDLYGYCFIWDVNTGEFTESWKYNGWANFIAFSPQTDDIVVVGGPDGIEVRSTNQAWRIPNSENSYMSLSSDNKRVVFADSCMVTVAEIGSSQKTTHILKAGKHEGGSAVSISPDLRSFAWADKAVHVHPLQQDKKSLNILPPNNSLPSTVQPNHGQDELMGILYDIQNTVQYNNTVANNRRLDGIKWYTDITTDVGIGAAMPKLWVVLDEALIAAYKDGSVSVWNRPDGI